MNTLIRKALSPLPRMVKWYLSRKRIYLYDGMSIHVLPGVFHPGLFFSTKLLLQYVSRQSIAGSSVLELGAGSGIVSVRAARMGARVTATDISSQAIDNIRQNGKAHDVTLNIVQSNLFDSLPPTPFDWILINPPYYPKLPLQEQDYAWYCGPNHEYFAQLFEGLPRYLGPTSRVIMVLSDVCNLDAIFKIASQRKFEFFKMEERRVWVDGTNYIYEVRRAG